MQDRGSRQAAMGEKRGFAESRLGVAGDHGRRNAGKFAEQHVFAAEGERDERGARLHHLEAELPGEVIGEAGRAQLRDGRAAGGDHQRRGLCGLVPVSDAEPAIRVGDGAKLVAEAEGDAACLTFGE